jgi:hypothetical protein
LFPWSISRIPKIEMSMQNKVKTNQSPTKR